MQSWRAHLTILLALLPLTALAQSSVGIDQSSIILALAAIIGGASINWLIIKINFPSVIGELVFGMRLSIIPALPSWPSWEVLYCCSKSD